MLVNLSDFFSVTGKEVQMDIKYETTEFTDGFRTYPVVDKTGFIFSFSNIEEGKAMIKASGSITLQMQCDRCLSDITSTLTLNFAREVLSPDQVTEESAGEQLFLREYSLDIDDLINNEILLSLPTKVLCKQDCKGICMKCGQNLNLGECGCDTFVPDPRMVAIKDIFNACKEV